MYLKSMSAIVENLLLDFDGFGVSGDSCKLLRLGQQCFERMTEIITHLSLYKARPKASSVLSPLSPEAGNSFPSSLSGSMTNVGVPNLPDVPTFEPTSRRRNKSQAKPSSGPKPDSAHPPDGLPVLPDVPGTENATKTSQGYELPSVPFVACPQDNTSPGSVSQPGVITQSKSLSPVEAAKLQNQRLLAAYRTRLSKTNKGQIASLNLSLQRRLAENVAVAKVREESLLKKQKERNRRLQEQAARSLHSTVGTSHDELERRKFYYSVLQFENNSKSLLSWRERLKANPKDVEQIKTLITFLLSVKSHPFTQMLHKYQYTTYNRVLPLIDKYSLQFEQATDLKQRQRNNNSISSIQSSKREARPRTQSVEADSLLNYSQSSSHMGTPEIGHLGNHPSFPEDTSQCSPFRRTCVISESDAVSLGSRDEGVSDLHDNVEVTSSNTNNDDSGGSTSPTTDTFELISPSEPKEMMYIASVEQMEKDALQRHLNNIVGDVHEYLGKLRSMLVVIYEDLDTLEARDVCYASLEAPFYKPVWGYIIALYRIVHKDKEDDLQRVFETHRHVRPTDIGVGEKYCLDDGLPSPYSYPYQPAVNELRKVTQCTSPLTKLECIVKSSRIICTCVEEHFARWDKQTTVSIGADDLLPILSYVILKSELPLLLAESHALVEFIDEGYLMGEEGYCLTSLQTALGYVLTLADESAVDHSSPDES